MSDEPTRAAFSAELLAAKPDMKTPQRAYFAWLLDAARYRFTCLKNNGEMPAVVWDKTHKASEAYVDYATKSGDCGRFYALTALDVYPFENRFSKELLKRDFGGAEVTRRLWLDSLEQSLTKCSTKLSRRTAMTIVAKRDKLRRIVGLDDQMLIDLRTKLITAVETNDASSVIAYSQAVTEREKALDSMNAAEHEANLRAIEVKARADAAVKMAQASPATAAGTATSGAGPKSTATGDMRQAAADVRKTAEDVHATAETGKKVLSLFGL